MPRRIAVLVLALSLAGLIASPVGAQKRSPKRVPITYYMNWFGDCTGGGYLSTKSVPNPDDCALYFPGLGDTHSFPSGRRPITLDAKQKITVDFTLIHVAHVAADFEVVLSGMVGDESQVIASGVQTVLVAGVGSTALHYELEADPALDRAALESVTLTVSWTNGVTYSSMDLQSDTAKLVMGGLK